MLFWEALFLYILSRDYLEFGVVVFGCEVVLLVVDFLPVLLTFICS